MIPRHKTRSHINQNMPTSYSSLRSIGAWFKFHENKKGKFWKALCREALENLNMVIGTYLHLLEDGGTIVGDDDLAVGTDEHLVHTLGSKRCLEETGDGSCCQDIDL